MNRATSIYLDLVRFSAAVIVFFVHARHARFTDGWLLGFKNYGNDAVMVFFVLSGFVIAYCTDRKERNINDYLLARFARLYSVVIPALCLTFVLDKIGSNIDNEIYSGPWYQDDSPYLRFFANLFFLNQIWFNSIVPFSNGPFWSLGYEFWYYILYAIVVFYKGLKRLFYFLVVVFLVGPKILLLFPVWLMGVASYRISQHVKLSHVYGFVFFLGSIFLYFLFRYFDVPLRFNWRTAEFFGNDFYELYLNGSKEFISSYIIGFIVSLNFIGFIAVSESAGEIFVFFERPIKFFASYTFTLYLLHYPLLNFYAAIMANDPVRNRDQILLFLFVFLSIYIIGNQTEHKKNNYKNLFKGIALGISRLRVANK